ncbi:hypothetical protein CRI94_10885 [Longibacter salinarum]|uniref:Uncharacterized protein n=1 Tax=Longibacter salinarum TaxID=1850348 RepID=A0A2A8CX28_9BACT|nr:hypothetical protein [Longibacter salinarum]PEN13144.1 hypothetical protein CRI94_10885 [Longibacter salinarum]
MSTFFREISIRRQLPIALVAGILVLWATALPAQAQRWSQRVEVLKPIEEDGPAYALLDSLVLAFESASDTVTVRREPGDSTQSLRELEDDLYEAGLGLVSATHVFIQYEFAVVEDDFIETIEELHFIYRSPNANEEDISIFTVRTDNPIARDVLMNGGLPRRENLNTIDTFASLLSFPRLAEAGDAVVVSLNNQTIRENFGERREDLASRLVDLVYDDAMPVITRTRKPRN